MVLKLITGNTETEFKQSMILHELMRRTWGADFISPIEQGLTKSKDFKVLDLGCGVSGALLLQLSMDYPLAKFVGVDKVPIFPKGFSRDNLQFVQGDILKGLPFEDDSFDFIHLGFLKMEFTEDQWEEIVIKELIRICKPGGWFEILDIEDLKSLSPSSKRLLSSVTGNLDSSGINIMEDVSELLISNDQIDKIYVDERLTPIGKWGGDLGKLGFELLNMIFYRFSQVIQLGLSKKEYETMVKQCVEEADYYHSYFVSLRVCCQVNY